MTDRVFAPWSQDPDVIDLNCAAPSAPAGVAAAYEAAVAELPPYLSSHGYYPAGLTRPARGRVAATYDERGLPTDARADHGDERRAGARGRRRAGTRPPPATGCVVEDPVYPNATQALGHRSARLVPAPVDPDGWDLAADGRDRAPGRTPAGLPDAGLPEPDRRC